MEIPGLSIFQGAESIKLDASVNRLEEEEALEDQRRRNEELGNELQIAFDDLIVDDDYTIETSENFATHFDHDDGGICSKNEEQEGHQKQEFLYGHLIEKECGQGDHKKCQSEIQSMKMTLESKDREIETISKLVHDEQKKNGELKKRLAISEAEKERSHMTRKQTHELLVESKTKISDLEDNLSQTKTKMKKLEDKKNDLLGELERTKMQLSDSLHKYHLVERNAGYSADRHAEHLIKQANERHAAQVDILQQQIDGLRDKLDTKERDFNSLETRYKELQRNREALLVDKSDVINQLARNLEESQRHCQELISKKDCTQENIRLQRTVNDLEKQTEDMRKTINNLTSRLDATTAELHLMDSVLGENENDISESLRRLSLTKGNIIGSTPLSSHDRISRLKNEVVRSMAGQKEKREEIKKLNEQMTRQSEEIKKMKNDENIALIEITTCKEENIRLKNRIRLLETELQEIQSGPNKPPQEKSFREHLDQNLEKIKAENEMLSTELTNTKSQCEIFKEKTEKLKTEVERLIQELKSNEETDLDRERLIKNLTIDLDELRQENESLKKTCENLNADDCQLDLEKHKFLLKDSQNECDRLKELYFEISQAKESLATELFNLKTSDLSRQLQDQQDLCEKLKKAQTIAELKCSEFSKLLEAQKQSHQKEIRLLRERAEKDKTDSLKSIKNASNSCTKCVEQYEQLAKLEVENLKLQRELTTCAQDLEDLKRDLDNAKTTITELNEKNCLQEERDQLIAELKEKAQQFEDYIKNQSSSKDTSGVSSPKFQDQGVETSPEIDRSFNRRKIESQIRDEMAKIFANKIKSIEINYRQQAYELEAHNAQLKGDLEAVIPELKTRQKEVDILKRSILIEREKMLELVDAKGAEFRQVNGILEKCRDELKSKQHRLEQLTQELQDRSEQIEAERKSMKAVMTQWEDQQRTLDCNEEEWKLKFKELKRDHQKFIEQIQSKYDSAKKTAANYKRYAEDKEKHMLQEYDRIKSGYEAALEKIEIRMKSTLEKQNREMKEKIREIEISYQEKLKKAENNDQQWHRRL